MALLMRVYYGLTTVVPRIPFYLNFIKRDNVKNLKNMVEQLDDVTPVPSQVPSAPPNYSVST